MGIPRSGVNPILEAEANRLIKQSLKGVTRPVDKADILTPWKETERRRRELLVSSGTPDPAVRSGIFHRSHNPARPELNSREGLARARRNPSGSLAGFMETYMDDVWKNDGH